MGIKFVGAPGVEYPKWVVEKFEETMWHYCQIKELFEAVSAVAYAHGNEIEENSVEKAKWMSIPDLIDSQLFHVNETCVSIVLYGVRHTGRTWEVVIDIREPYDPDISHIIKVRATAKSKEKAIAMIPEEIWKRENLSQ